MNVLSVILALVTLATAKRYFPMLQPLSKEMSEYINSAKTTWVAQENMKGLKIEHLKPIFSGKSKDSKRHQHSLYNRKIEIPNKDIPDSFDARHKWSHCSTLTEISDQGPCASSWAIAATSAMSDRLCITSGGKLNIRLSADDVMACCTYCLPGGCNGSVGGSEVAAAWDFYQAFGIVSGGAYGSKAGCKPYSIAPCGKGKQQPCQKRSAAPKCVRKCAGGYTLPYAADKHYANSTYTVSDVPKIQAEIMTRGPVGAYFIMYADFPSYKKGIYQHVAGERIGYHSAKILGWGEENGTPYWLAANSWSSEWGNDGYFKILRGRNECELEIEMFAGQPRAHLNSSA